jgi:uncharacterized protein (TIGR02391 family)
MDTLPKLYPSVRDLLATPPADLAPLLLKFARVAEKNQNGMFDPNYVNQLALGDEYLHSSAPRYSPLERPKVEDRLAEVWHFIDRAGFIMPAPGMNGANGFKKFTGEGNRIADDFDMQKYSEAAAFPKTFLHPAIAEKATAALLHNDLEPAVFEAFKAVEVAVREAAKLPADDGVKLMRKAFDDRNGPLTNMSDPVGEREALAHLFAGAFGVFRNSTGHRYTDLSDLRDAQYQILLASLLLRIVDARRKS